MSVDTECDVLIESRGRPAVGRTIRMFRDRLIAEHLGVSRETFQDAIERSAGRLHGAIAELSTDARSLRELKALPEYPEAVIDLAAVADPEEPIALDYLLSD